MATLKLSKPFARLLKKEPEIKPKKPKKPKKQAKKKKPQGILTPAKTMTAAQAFEWLVEAYPKVFTTPVPLAIGCHKSIRRPENLNYHNLHSALHTWVKADAYQSLLIKGATRYALDGTPCGEVDVNG